MSYHVLDVRLAGGLPAHRRIEVAPAPGLTVVDVRDRLFKLSMREAAARYVADEPTLLLEHDPAITVNHPAWIFDESRQLFRQKTGDLYLFPPLLPPSRLAELHAAGFRIVAWRRRTQEYPLAGEAGWQPYVEVVDHPADFFGVALRGSPAR